VITKRTNDLTLDNESLLTRPLIQLFMIGAYFKHKQYHFLWRALIRPNVFIIMYLLNTEFTV